MFTQLFFLITLLLLVGSVSEPSSVILSSIELYKLWGQLLGFYVCILGLIYFQSFWFKNQYRKEPALFLANVELLLFFACAYFILDLHQVFFTASLKAFGQTFLTVFSLLLYFVGIAFSHYACERREKISATSIFMPVRFLLPFVLPFVFFVFFGEAMQFLPLNPIVKGLALTANSFNTAAFYLIVSLFMMALLMVFFPPLLVLIWNCRPFEDPALTQRLSALCQRASFTHAGFKIWTVLDHALTAAILGIVGRFRYVIFTRKLLQKLSPEAIEAILAHEIGHSYHRHLFIYPLILSGIIVVGSLFSLFFFDAFSQHIILHDLIADSTLWTTLAPLILLIPFVLIAGLYFRYVFGFFSRLFERQADLHVFRLHVAPEALIEALDEVGIASGYSHNNPNWHHYSISERIDFLNAAKRDPKIIERHHKKVRNYLGIYLIGWLLAVALLMASLFPDGFGFNVISSFNQTARSDISEIINAPLRRRAADVLLQKEKLPGNRLEISQALEKALSYPSSFSKEGVFEYEAAGELFTKNQLAASATMMLLGWESMDWNQASDEEISAFSSRSHQILSEASKQNLKDPVFSRLEHAQKHFINEGKAHE